MYKLKIAILIIFSLISINSFGSSKDEIDDMLVLSTQKIVTKDFAGAKQISLDLLSSEHNMSYSQKVNTLNKLLELSYILNTPRDALLYGNKLMTLLNGNPKYSEVQKRLVARICHSSDWAKFKKQFSEICVH